MLNKCKRKISKEDYEKIGEGKYLPGDMMVKYFSDSERMGYGVYCATANLIDGQYYVTFEMGDSCD